MWWSSVRSWGPGPSPRARRPGRRLASPAKAFVTPAKAGAQCLVALALLAGCGFQLRGDPVVGIRALNVTSTVPSTVATNIRRALAVGPTRVVPNAKDAEAVLRIITETRDKQVYTITGTGRVFEFELRLAVTYEMTVPGREVPVIAPTQAVARRVITYAEAAPIAKEAEEQLLFRDMQVELATRILRQVNLARRDM